jgi:hypothetical protein
MIPFDKAMCAFSREHNWYYRRYSDDILIVCGVDQLVSVEDSIVNLLAGLGLQLNTTKTDKVLFRRLANGNLRGHKFSEPTKLKNLQYLGLEFSGERSYIRAASSSRYHRRMKSAIGEAVKRALGKNSKGKHVGRRALNNRYLDPNEQNFMAYTLRAAKIFDEDGLAHGITGQFRDGRHLMRSIIKKKTVDRVAFLERIRAKK